MATTDEVQAALDSGYGNNLIKISKHAVIDGTYDAFYATSIKDGQSGKSHFCRTTSANSAELQAIDINNSLSAEGNSDANLR